MASHGQHIINQRRKQDNVYKVMDDAIKSDRKVLQIARFENSTALKIENKSKKTEIERRKNEYNENLMARRESLANLYNLEMQSWRNEVLSKVETQEDRKSRIMERAYALREAREQQRQTFVQEKYNEQWRDANDDARTLDSKAMTLHMNKQRIQQIQEKLSKKSNVSSLENAFLEVWKRQLDALEKRDNEKEQLRRRIDHETSIEIKAQIQENARRKEQQFAKNRQEEELELEKLRLEIEAEEAKQKKLRSEAYMRGKEVLRYNSENLMLKQEEESLTRERDAILLDYALRKEAEANMAEDGKRNADREAAKMYRKYLEEQMVREAEDTAFVDEIRKREEEKVWKQRDDALQARDKAREYLMQMVDQGRQEQIYSKKEQLEKEKREGQIFASKFIDDARLAVQIEKEAEEIRRQKNMDNMDKLKHQIDYRKYKEELQKQEEYLADKQMQHIERQHKQRLAEQGGQVRDFRPLKKNNWYS